MKPLIKRHQIPVFFVLTLLIGWFPWYTGQGSIIIVAPTLAGLIVAFLAEGKDGLVDVLRRIVRGEHVCAGTCSCCSCRCSPAWLR